MRLRRSLRCYRETIGKRQREQERTACKRAEGAREHANKEKHASTETASTAGRPSSVMAFTAGRARQGRRGARHNGQPRAAASTRSTRLEGGDKHEGGKGGKKVRGTLRCAYSCGRLRYLVDRQRRSGPEQVGLLSQFPICFFLASLSLSASVSIFHSSSPFWPGSFPAHATAQLHAVAGDRARAACR